MDRNDVGSGPAVGVVGLGRMGAPIADRLTRTFRTHGFDVDPHRRNATSGIVWAETLLDLTRTADVLVTVLPGVAELKKCMKEALPRMQPGSMWLDLTSGDPAVTRDLAAQANRGGVEVVSAPMGGSVDEARAGELIFFASGSEVALDRAQPVLERLSAPGGVRRAGGRAEDGQIVKLLANGMWFAHAVAAAEALLIGESFGLGASDLYRLLRDSSGGSRFMDEHLGRLLDGDYLETFGIDRVVEELDTIGNMARSADVPTGVLDASARLHHQAFERFGPALGELLAVKLLEERAGRQIRR